jgi:hypothetical protein
VGRMTLGPGKAPKAIAQPEKAPTERIVEVIKEVRVEVPVEVVKLVDRPVEVIKEVIKYVDKPIEVIKEVRFEYPVEKIVEKEVIKQIIKEVPVIHIEEKVVRIPVVEVRHHVPFWARWAVAVAILELTIILMMAVK